MAKFLIALFTVVLMSGCMTGGERVTDFSDRSIGYGWLDIKDIDANRLHSVVIYQLRPQTEDAYWNVKVVKFEDGYLFYSFAFPQGAFKTYSIAGQRCALVLCTNTNFEYHFGKQGDDAGAILVEQPGVYSFGVWKLEEVKTGFFEQGKFDVKYATKAPSKTAMLNELLKDAEGMDPILGQRIREEIAKQSP